VTITVGLSTLWGQKYVPQFFRLEIVWAIYGRYTGFTYLFWVLRVRVFEKYIGMVFSHMRLCMVWRVWAVWGCVLKLWGPHSLAATGVCVFMGTHLRAVERHLPYDITVTLCYLPPDACQRGRTSYCNASRKFTSMDELKSTQLSLAIRPRVDIMSIGDG